MAKKIATLILLILLSINLCGCFTVLVGAAAGAGTAVWLSDKLTQDVNTPFDRAIKAVHSGLESLKLSVTKETATTDSSQIMSKYTDGKTIWVDVKRLTDVASRIQVRVGVPGDKEAATKVLDAIRGYL